MALVAAYIQQNDYWINFDEELPDTAHLAEFIKQIFKSQITRDVYKRQEYINQHLGEDIDLKSLARISNFSPFYFHRIMKAFLGEPIGTFIRCV